MEKELESRRHASRANSLITTSRRNSIASVASVTTAGGQNDGILRNYEVFPGQNKFYCRGRVMTGPSVVPVIITTFLILVPSSFFVAFPGMDQSDGRIGGWFSGYSVAALAVVSTICLWVAAVGDPGIVPRNDVLDEENDVGPHANMARLVVQGRAFKLKYCHTCDIFRPPRTVHCGECDNCVSEFDHHCPWIGTCVAKRNYRAFFYFVSCLALLILDIISFSIINMAELTAEFQEDGRSHADAFLAMLHRQCASFVLVFVGFAAACFVWGLLGFHIYLAMARQTTYEHFKHDYAKGSPYSYGRCKNFLLLFCSKQSISLVNATEESSAYPEWDKGVVELTAKEMKSLAEHHRTRHGPPSLRNNNNKEEGKDATNPMDMHRAPPPQYYHSDIDDSGDDGRGADDDGSDLLRETAAEAAAVEQEQEEKEEEEGALFVDDVDTEFGIEVSEADKDAALALATKFM